MHIYKGKKWKHMLITNHNISNTSVILNAPNSKICDIGCCYWRLITNFLYVTSVLLSKMMWHLYLLGKIKLNFWHFLKIIFCQIVLSTRSVQGAKKESLERVIVELRWPRIHFHFGSVKNSLQMGWHFISADISILQDVEEFISSITTIWKKCFLRSDNMNHTKYHFHVTPFG